MIAVKFDRKKLALRLNKLQGVTDETAARVAAEVILNANRRRNEKEVAPDGKSWEPLAESTKKQKKRADKILYETGDLLRLIIASEGGGFEAGTPSEYAPYHQEGTDPYKIKPKNKKALSFGGKVYRSVNHPGLSARPIMGVNEDDEAKIKRAVGRLIEERA